MYQNNVIYFNPTDFYCARQCREAIKWCKQQKNPIYDVEIKGEQELYSTFMDAILGRKVA